MMTRVRVMPMDDHAIIRCCEARLNSHAASAVWVFHAGRRLGNRVTQQPGERPGITEGVAHFPDSGMCLPDRHEAQPALYSACPQFLAIRCTNTEVPAQSSGPLCLCQGTHGLFHQNHLIARLRPRQNAAVSPIITEALPFVAGN
jgi:hypothetical protein